MRIQDMAGSDAIEWRIPRPCPRAIYTALRSHALLQQNFHIQYHLKRNRSNFHSPMQLGSQRVQDLITSYREHLIEQAASHHSDFQQ
jgi:hypothetical protein